MSLSIRLCDSGIGAAALMRCTPICNLYPASCGVAAAPSSCLPSCVLSLSTPACRAEGEAVVTCIEGLTSRTGDPMDATRAQAVGREAAISTFENRFTRDAGR